MEINVFSMCTVQRFYSYGWLIRSVIVENFWPNKTRNLFFFVQKKSERTAYEFKHEKAIIFKSIEKYSGIRGGLMIKKETL